MTTAPAYAKDLSRTVARAAARLRSMPEEMARSHPAPDKWSPAEIIGHLIDSASNNHQRFVRARFTDGLRFAGYDQDEWVGAQRYQDAPWPELVTLWEMYNLHIARVMESTPEAIRTRPRHDHNLDEIAWETVPADQPVTLEYFMRDYLGHLEHHLRQIDAGLADPPERLRPR